MSIGGVVVVFAAAAIANSFYVASPSWSYALRCLGGVYDVTQRQSRDCLINYTHFRFCSISVVRKN